MSFACVLNQDMPFHHKFSMQAVYEFVFLVQSDLAVGSGMFKI